VFTSVHAQQIPQIPTLQVCNQVEVEGKARVEIADRNLEEGIPGFFEVKIDVKYVEGMGYPDGTLEITAKMTGMLEPSISITGVTFEQLGVAGRLKFSPTAYLSGRCQVPGFSGCRFWMTVTDNGMGIDVIGFLVFDEKGRTVAHGTGPTMKGDITIEPLE